MAPPLPRVLFVVPPWNFHRGNVWRHVMGIIPPVGMATLAAVLERDGVARADILDAQALGLDEAQTAAEVARRAPDWVGMGPGTTLANSAYEVARRVRARLPAVRIVMGGPHPTALPEEPLRRAPVDFVLAGEAETTLPRLVRGDKPDTIPGLAWLGDDGAVRKNPPPPLIEDLDTLPDPAFDKLPIGRYRPSLGNYRHLPSLGITMTRGCYGTCTFCSRLLFGTRVRTFSTGRIVGLVESLRDRYRLREIQFYDDLFLGTKARIREFCDAMIERRVGVSWACFMRAELADRDIARRMRQAGCYLVDFGVESGDEAVLQTMHKKVALTRTMEAVEAFRAEGVLLKLGFMMGYPGESRASILRTLDLAVHLAPHAAVFNLATPYPGTELHAQCRADGTLLSEDWDLYDQAHPLVRLPDVSPGELEALYREAHRRFYLRPAAVMRWARVLRSPDQLAMMARAFGGLLRFMFLERGGSRGSGQVHRTPDA